MKKLIVLFALLLAFAAAPAFAAVKTYQVTGPVVEVTSDTIIVMKGKDKWEIAKGSADIPATVKAGDKVTIEYSMTAAKVTAKTATAAKTK
jgi:RNase P/RNase MRP subunit p29